MPGGRRPFLPPRVCWELRYERPGTQGSGDGRLSMQVFTVHMRRPPLDPEQDIRLVKEGFSWPAFFFSLLWAVWCRLWLVAAGILAVEVALNALLGLLGADALTRMAVSLAFSMLLGVFGSDLKRWTLFRSGYLEVAVVTGTDRDAAERRFWDERPSLAADLVR